MTTREMTQQSLKSLSDVPQILSDYFQEVYGDNLRAVFIYGSSLLRDVQTPVSTLSREEFEDKRCDFILIMDDVEKAFATLLHHWPGWTEEMAREMSDLSQSLGGRIVYFVPETIKTYQAEFKVADGGEGMDLHEDYHIPYKFGILGLDELLRDLSSRREHFYIAGRASKWSHLNLLHVSDDGLKDEIDLGLSGLRRDVAEIARQLAPCGAPREELVHRYFLFSYLCESWRMDFMSKPRSLIKGLGDDVHRLVSEAIDDVPPPSVPDLSMRKEILRTIVRGNVISMKMSLGNSRSNKLSYSPNRMSGNTAYVWRKVVKIAPDILLMPFRIPLFIARILAWRWGWI